MADLQLGALKEGAETERARILALLESEEMVEAVSVAINEDQGIEGRSVKNSIWLYGDIVRVALSVIAEKIGG